MVDIETRRYIHVIDKVFSFRFEFGLIMRRKTLLGPRAAGGKLEHGKQHSNLQYLRKLWLLGEGRF